jgi:hypothetical protein
VLQSVDQVAKRHKTKQNKTKQDNITQYLAGEKTEHHPRFIAEHVDGLINQPIQTNFTFLSFSPVRAQTSALTAASYLFTDTPSLSTDGQRKIFRPAPSHKHLETLSVPIISEHQTSNASATESH